MGHVLVTLPSDKSKYGYSFLVDTKEVYQTRTNTLDKPAPMPSLPLEPDYTSKVIYKRYLSDKNHYHACKKVTVYCIELLEEKFPECLRLLRVSDQLPRTLTLQEAFEHVKDRKLSLAERQKEFLKCTEQLSALTHSHEPFSPSLAVCFGDSERIRRLQHLVEPSDSECKGISYQMLCVSAHLKMHD